MKKNYSRIIGITCISIFITTLFSCQQDDDSPAPHGIELQKNATTTNLTQNEALKAILAANPDLKIAGWDINTNPKEWPGVVSINDVVRELTILNHLNQIPPEIRGLKYLKKLTINHGAFTTLPEEIGALTELEKLNLGNNELTSLPDVIGNFKRLQTLFLYGNNLEAIPSTIKNLRNLRGLALQKNKLYQLPEEVKNLTNLRWINLEDNEFHILPIELDELPNLQPQNIRSIGNPLTKMNRDDVKTLVGILKDNPEFENIYSITGGVPWDIKSDPTLWTGVSIDNASGNLIYLYLPIPNGITNLSPKIGEFKNVISLTIISAPSLLNIPKEIGQLITLQSLYISADLVTTIPSEIGQLTNLINLNLPFNSSLTSLPKEIGQLIKLETLRISSNELSTLPIEINQLNKLSNLSISRGKLTSLKLDGLSNLKVLSLRGALRLIPLENLIIELKKLPNIKQLYIGDNNIKHLPKEIGELTSLTFLDSRYNLLTSIPLEISKLTQLKQLLLFGNSLTNIPKEIGQLTTLEILGLSNNQLTSIPSEISNLTNLTSLYLSNNQLTSIPKEICDLNLQYIDIDLTCN